MPVPSPSGSALRWPAAAEVLERAECSAATQTQGHPDLLAVGVFGSYGLSEWHSLPQWNPRPAGGIDAIDPDVCVNKDSSRVGILFQICESHEARRYW